MKLIRTLSLVTVLLVVVGLITGCQPHTGAAAVVDGDRITEGQLDKYVRGDAQTFSTGDGEAIVPRELVLSRLIEAKVITRMLEKNGGAPTDSQLADARKAVLGTDTEATATAELTQRGFKPAFAPLFVNSQALRTVLRARFNGVQTQQDADKLQAAINDAGVKVSLSPGYGTWNPGQLIIDGAGKAGDFLQTTDKK